MKKGALSISTLQWLVIRIPLLIAAFIFLFSIISAYTVSKIDTTALEMEIINARLLSYLYYQDEDTGRNDIGVIDPLKLTRAYQEELLKLIKYKDDKHIAAKIELTSSAGKITSYYSKHWYDRWKPIAEAKLKGEKVGSRNFSIPVVIHDSNAFQIVLKKQFLETIKEQTTPDVIAAVEKEIADLEKKGFGGAANGMITIDIVKPT